VMRLAEQDGDPRPVRLDTLRTRWPPKGFMLEARARRRGGSLWRSALIVLRDTLLGWLVFVTGRRVRSIDPALYRLEVTTNTDFCKHDETLCFVIDCALGRIDAIEQYLRERAADGAFRYGIDIADTALMTCLVTSTADSLHVHFVDGGGGGYTNAAKKLKASRRLAAA